MRAMLRAGLVTISVALSAALGVSDAFALPAVGQSADPDARGNRTTGVAGPQSYVATAALDGRTDRDLSNHAVVDKYPAGSSIVVVCQSSGGATYGGSTIWDLTSDGLWIPDYFVNTGTTGWAPHIPRCSIPKPYVAARTLDGRTEKRLGNHAHPDRYPRGSTVKITCQAFGAATHEGSFLWNRTVEGLWVPDYLVKTGTNGLVAGLPRCDGASAGTTPGSAGTTKAATTTAPAGTTDTSRRKPVDLQFSSRGAAFIAAYEGYRPAAYNDAGGHCTIAYGHLIHRGRCTLRDRAAWGIFSKDRAVALLWQDAETYAAGVRAALPNTPLAQHEFDALVSLSYNIGNGGFRGSAVREGLAQATPEYGAVPNRMMSWVSSSGVKLAGLERRRVNEGTLFRTGSYAIIPA